MAVASRSGIPAWRCALAGVLILACIVLAVWLEVSGSSDGSVAPGPSPVLQLGPVMCVLAAGALIWWRNDVVLRCPACGYALRMNSRRFERMERDERYDDLRSGATGAERLGMWLERNTSWAGDAGPTESEQGRHPREWYSRYAVVSVVLVVVLVATGAIAAVMF